MIHEAYHQKRPMDSITEFKRHWVRYLAQSSIATFCIFLILIVLSMEEVTLVASLGASVFVVFVMPHLVVASPRHVIGGYLIALLCGFLGLLIPHTTPLVATLIYALTVGLSIFCMVAADMEHPPAAAAALSFAVNGVSAHAAVVTIGCVVFLSVVHFYLRKYLKDIH